MSCSDLFPSNELDVFVLFCCCFCFVSMQYDTVNTAQNTQKVNR